MPINFSASLHNFIDNPRKVLAKTGCRFQRIFLWELFGVVLGEWTFDLIRRNRFRESLSQRVFSLNVGLNGGNQRSAISHGCLQLVLILISNFWVNMRELLCSRAKTVPGIPHFMIKTIFFLSNRFQAESRVHSVVDLIKEDDFSPCSGKSKTRLW